MLVLSPRSYSLTPTTRADPVTRGKTYHLTRRCDRRLRRLTPDSKVTSIVKFALFHAAKECGIEVHAACFSTNHFHLVITDPNGRHPDFMQRMNSMIARALNAQHGVKGHFWGPGSYEKVELIGFDALLRTLVYVTLNPVKDGLVSSPKAYPGFLTRPDQVGCTFRAHKPATAFFGGNRRGGDPTALPEDSTLPDDVELTLTLPPTHLLPEGMDLAAYRRVYQAAVDARLAEILVERKGRPFLGARRILAANPLSPPPTPEPYRPRGERPSPVSGTREECARWREERTAWRRDYVQARDSWPEDPRVALPPGSWLLGQRYGAPVLAHPSA